MGAYNLEYANVEYLQTHFDLFDAEARALLAKGLAIPAYDKVLKTSHAFNILDARGSISVTERARFFGRMRSLARQCAQLWVKNRESLGYPLGFYEENKPLYHAEEVLNQAVKKISSAKSFVLEVGTEELPSQDVADSTAQLKFAMTSFLHKQRLSHGDMSIFGTPRRLVVYIKQLAPQQDEVEIECRGPPVQKCFDSEGNPTKAIEGFCQRNNVSLADVFRKVDGKTEYIYIRKKEPARHAIQILAEALPSIISGISFSKTMHWNTKTYFSRPIRWVVALHGDSLVPFTFSGITSGQISHSLRASTNRFIKVDCAENYISSLTGSGIILDMEERKRTILQSSEALTKMIGGKINVDVSLLEEIAGLVEAPTTILGSFDKMFLELPADVLITVMRKHQRYIPVMDASNGELLPAFVTVANGPIDELVVCKGNENVLRARYEDAKFFYKMDTRMRLIEFRNHLKGIVFQEKLGTMLDKSIRIEKMIQRLAVELGLKECEVTTAMSAAEVAMSDLATSMVTEFTALAGIMGRHYAMREGYSMEIANAIFEKVLPRFAGDELPSTDVGIILSLCDRLDSLVGLFAAGCQPSANSDPFGLRRISYGLVQILVEKEKNLDLIKALEIAADAQTLEISSTVMKEVLLFVTRRLEQLLVDQGAHIEIVRSVLAERAHIPYLAALSVKQMENLSKTDAFRKVIEAYSRPTKIIRGKSVDSKNQVDENLFVMEEEKALWNAFQQVASQVGPEIGIDTFIESSAQLIQPLENYFNNVFVMADDENLRKNRLAVLLKIANLPSGIADLSCLPGF